MIVSNTTFLIEKVLRATWNSRDVMMNTQTGHALVDIWHGTCLQDVRSYIGADDDVDYNLVI